MELAPARRTAAVAALSGDTLLLARLRREGFTAVVHSAFDRVVNLRPADGPHLFCLAARTVDDAPDTVVLDTPSCRPLALRPGDVVSTEAGIVRLPAGGIELAGARPWEPVLPELPMRATASAWLRGFLRRRALGDAADPWLAAVRPLLAQRLDGLLAAIRRGDAAGLAHAVDRLVGLGAGLTPSGDDMLVGVTLVAHLPGSALAPACGALDGAVAASAGRTTDISHATLAQAAAGRVRESVAALLRAMAGGSTDRQLDGHGDRVAAIGHTSGTDILTGLSAALDLDLELRNNELRGDR